MRVLGETWKTFQGHDLEPSRPSENGGRIDLEIPRTDAILLPRMVSFVVVVLLLLLLLVLLILYFVAWNFMFNFLFIPSIGWRLSFFQIKLSNSFLQSGVGERPFLEKLRHALRFCMLDLLRHQSKFAAHDVHDILWLPHLIIKPAFFPPILRNTKCRCWVLRSMSPMKADTWRCAYCVCLVGVFSMVNSSGHREIVVEHVGLYCAGQGFPKRPSRVP